MKKWLFLLFIFAGACSSSPSNKPSPSIREYSFVESITTVKRINCSSRKALHCMACALQGEAANQPSKGVYAVGVTIMTRAKGNINKVCKVTKARRQFEGMRKKGLLKISKKIWEISRQVIQQKETGWTHFWSPKEQRNLNRNKPLWAKKFEQRLCHKEKIGDHIFFNKNKCERKRSISSY